VWASSKPAILYNKKMPGTLSKREELERLYAERENIEKSIAAQLIVLQNEGVGMLDQLVDRLLLKY
jgi:hypothetical protein